MHNKDMKTFLTICTFFDIKTNLDIWFKLCFIYLLYVNWLNIFHQIWLFSTSTILHTNPSSSPSEGILPQTILRDSSSDYQLNDHAGGLNIDLLLHCKIKRAKLDLFYIPINIFANNIHYNLIKISQQ